MRAVPQGTDAPPIRAYYGIFSCCLCLSATHAWIDMSEDATRMTAPDAHHPTWHRSAPGHANERTLRCSEPSAHTTISHGVQRQGLEPDRSRRSRPRRTYRCACGAGRDTHSAGRGFESYTPHHPIFVRDELRGGSSLTPSGPEPSRTPGRTMLHAASFDTYTTPPRLQQEPEAVAPFFDHMARHRLGCKRLLAALLAAAYVAAGASRFASSDVRDRSAAFACTVAAAARAPRVPNLDASGRYRRKSR